MGLGQSNQVVTPRLHSLSLTQSLNGICIPILYGTARLPQNLLQYLDFTSGKPYQQGGKGLGKSGSAYEYYAAILGALCQGPISAIGTIYSQNGQLKLNSTSETYTVPSGGGTYSVANASSFSSDAGVGVAASYSVTAHDFGSSGPVTLNGTQTAAKRYAATAPSVGQYTHDGEGNYTFPASAAGETVTICYNYSLYTLSETEDDTVPTSAPFEVTVQYATQLTGDEGVHFVYNGAPLSKVGGSPTQGQYSESSGNYTFSPADAGRAVAITYAWQQTDSNVDPSSTLQFTLIEGNQGQQPSTYMQTMHPSQALGNSTIACVFTPKMDLGESAQLPNYNYEAFGPMMFGAGIMDADTAGCIADLLTNPYYGSRFQGAIDVSLSTIAKNYWNSNDFFISPLLNSAQPCAGIIESWCNAGNVATFWSEGQAKFIPYGDTTTVGNGFTYTPQTHPVVDLDDDDFLASGASEDPVTIERTPWQDAFNQVKVQFSNRLNNYDPGVVTEQDDFAIEQFTERPEGQQDYSFLKTQEAATFAANIRLKRLVYIRKKYTFKISGIRYCFLEPMDIVTLTDLVLGLDKEPVRIIEIQEDSDRIYSVTAEEFPWGTSTATLYAKQPGKPGPPPPALASPGKTNVVSIFEPTARVATTLANSAFQIWAALNGGPNWGGCNVWVSFDDQSYQKLDPVQRGPSRAGTLTAPIASLPDPDTTSALSVSTSGELFNVTAAQANALTTLSLIGEDEYVAYQNASLTATSQQGNVNSYNLTTLRRGQFSSPVVAHVTGESFIRLDSQIYQYSYDPSLTGTQIWFKFPAFNLLQNQLQGLDECIAYPHQVGGSNLATNMMVDSVADADGVHGDIRIYQFGQPVGTPGTAHLANGAVITLPAVTQTGESLGTTYYVNYNPVGASYVFYTDMSVWLSDEATLGYIRVGSTTTDTISGSGTGTGTGATFQVDTDYISDPSGAGAKPYYVVNDVTVVNGGTGYAQNRNGRLVGTLTNRSSITASQRLVTMTVTNGVITDAQVSDDIYSIQWAHVPTVSI